jgi:hypothetical protein
VKVATARGFIVVCLAGHEEMARAFSRAASRKSARRAAQPYALAAFSPRGCRALRGKKGAGFYRQTHAPGKNMAEAAAAYIRGINAALS